MKKFNIGTTDLKNKNGEKKQRIWLVSNILLNGICVTGIRFEKKRKTKGASLLRKLGDSICRSYGNFAKMGYKKISRVPLATDYGLFVSCGAGRVSARSFASRQSL